MKSRTAEDILSDICSFCTRRLYCKDTVMVGGINKIIKEVAPGLTLSCENFNSCLTTAPNNRIGFAPVTLDSKDVRLN